MKKVHCDIKSTRVCLDCGAFLKANLVNRKPTAEFCFSCTQAHQEPTSNPIRTARQVRQNPIYRSDRRIKKGIPLRRLIYV